MLNWRESKISILSIAVTVLMVTSVGVLAKNYKYSNTSFSNGQTLTKDHMNDIVGTLDNMVGTTCTYPQVLKGFTSTGTPTCGNPARFKVCVQYSDNSHVEDTTSNSTNITTYNASRLAENDGPPECTPCFDWTDKSFSFATAGYFTGAYTYKWSDWIINGNGGNLDAGRLAIDLCGENE